MSAEAAAMDTGVDANADSAMDTAPDTQSQDVSKLIKAGIVSLLRLQCLFAPM